MQVLSFYGGFPIRTSLPLSPFYSQTSTIDPRSNAIHPVIFLDSYPKPCYGDSWFPGSPRWALALTLPRPASLFVNQLPLDPSTAVCISFVFNTVACRRSSRGSTATLLSSFL